QAEDGIRDDLVTGVQTCALPICRPRGRTLGEAGRERGFFRGDPWSGAGCGSRPRAAGGVLGAPRRRRPARGADGGPVRDVLASRSEERRVGERVGVVVGGVYVKG